MQGPRSFLCPFLCHATSGAERDGGCLCGGGRRGAPDTPHSAQPVSQPRPLGSGAHGGDDSDHSARELPRRGLRGAGEARLGERNGGAIHNAVE